ncbi:hypothetical protein CVT26_010761 [Gymnopilus dilepis]|uniref:Uncharacterized protein n=1 Tax=Gymnopilus dilepis TaxID=231916 RepID=A0A409W558_9AGAR|nr:hypothetical protein CVT26_010761 [Gymnopilus dilepis]
MIFQTTVVKPAALLRRARPRAVTGTAHFRSATGLVSLVIKDGPVPLRLALTATGDIMRLGGTIAETAPAA